MGIKKTIKHQLGNIHFVFALTEDESIKLLHFSNEKYVEKNIDKELLEASSLVEMQITGLNQPDHKGDKLGNTLVARNLKLKNIDLQKQIIKVTQSYQEGQLNLLVETVFDGTFSENVIRCTNKVENIGDAIGLEYVTTLNLLGIFNDNEEYSFPNNQLYIPHNAWQGELQWQNDTLKTLGLNAHLDGWEGQDSTKTVRATNNSSWSCAQYSPLAVLKNHAKDEVFFWQIENNGEWHWELTDCNFGKNLVLRAGGPTESTNHWWKKLGSGESFTTVPAAFGFTNGNFNDAIISLNHYRRKIRKPNIDNETCPVIFNDYMNSLGGDPTTDKELPMIKNASEVGCEYYVIDCGWYSDGAWWDNVGEWLPSQERFPNGIEEVIHEIKKHNMIPGLWLEIEVMGINSEFANSLPDDWFICRHGVRIKDHSRYHLDFRNQDVRDYATKTVKRLIEDYGIGYIKMDYNTPTGIGSDLYSDSFSDALLGHNRAYIEWIDSIMNVYPELVIENCGSGGMRHDYAMLARHSIQSVTDQTDYVRNGAIAAVCSTAITPEQSAIWSYPMTDCEEEVVIFNMINTMLFRIHQSGHLGNLEGNRLALVKEGIDVYKKIRGIIPIANPRWFSDVPHLDDPWFHFALETPEEIYLAVWKTTSEEDYVIDLGQDFHSVEQIYPTSNPADIYTTVSDQKITFSFNGNNIARLYKLTK